MLVLLLLPLLLVLVLLLLQWMLGLQVWVQVNQRRLLQVVGVGSEPCWVDLEGWDEAQGRVSLGEERSHHQVQPYPQHPHQLSESSVKGEVEGAVCLQPSCYQTHCSYQGWRSWKLCHFEHHQTWDP
jgi:hypothetical protein